ncbi:hypothetical protein [Bradyrhizobium sp. AS23.2]|uniref:hypothetical protein n=1 Tax=Bradyrhizobium sp. AS23.2 TaxID=1680155 RepID=UPI001AD7FD4F|nr:hypothetical protein [Bradyrhizobium sp. AS23.2]
MQTALSIAKKARRNRKNLAGDNFYGNKLAQLRIDATNAFADISDSSVGDTSALAELIEPVFAAATSPKHRTDCARELSHALQTKWRQARPRTHPGNELFPLTLITQTGRRYLLKLAEQMNGSYREGWYDACAVMMRRIVEIALIEAFEHHNIADKIKDKGGDYLQLSDLVDRALNEPAFRLGRNTKRELPKLRTIGHLSAHGRSFTAQKADIDKLEAGIRIVIEDFLRQAGLV